MPAKSPQPLMKDGLGRESVLRLRGALCQADTTFDGQSFQKKALRGLSALELKARVDHFIAVINAHLPADFATALPIVVSAGEALRTDGLKSAQTLFAPWPLIDWVGVYGLANPESSLAALRRLTSLFSAEFAVRPFILADAEATLVVFGGWLDDPDHHVRRLVSEGTRPLLPWGVQLPGFRAEPQPALTLLEHLKDDESAYVRRSVANHLNDVAKDHPRKVVKIAKNWWRGGSPERKALVRHGLRTLVKKGDSGALQVLGYTTKPQVAATLSISDPSLAIGGVQHLSLLLASQSKRRQNLVIDYAVHHQRSGGKVSAKVFKWKNVELAPGEEIVLAKKHAFIPRTVRRLYPGLHKIEVLVSGHVVSSATFELVL